MNFYLPSAPVIIAHAPLFEVLWIHVFKDWQFPFSFIQFFSSLIKWHMHPFFWSPHHFECSFEVLAKQVYLKSSLKLPYPELWTNERGVSSKVPKWRETFFDVSFSLKFLSVYLDKNIQMIFIYFKIYFFRIIFFFLNVDFNFIYHLS